MGTNILYVDWSGDPGFRFRAGSSLYLSIACVMSSPSFAQPLSAIRDDYHLGRKFYFRFANVSNLIKPIFFSELAQADIGGVVLRVDKPALKPEFRSMKGNQLIGHFIAECIDRLPPAALQDYSLMFDGSRDESAATQMIRITISAQLRSRNLPRPKHIAPRPAREEDGLQIADMLAGAAASRHLADNALLGRLRGKVDLIDYSEDKHNRSG
jgi:hypothetical protein